jgi:tRNA A-37 threonylcarbamoyl transferase component Bud32
MNEKFEKAEFVYAKRIIKRYRKKKLDTILGRLKEWSRVNRLGQKIVGLIVVIIAVFLPKIDGEMIVASIFLFPIGIGAMVTKDKVFII